MRISRPYRPADADACLRIFDSNVPGYFGAHERAGFAAYLQHPDRTGDYRVIERDGRIVACAGLAIDGTTAAFCWGMVEHGLHRQGLGHTLAQARLGLARAVGAQRVTLSTSQHTRGFYAALGFTVTRVVTNGHGPGLDAVEMEQVLSGR
ncbi:MULTISPECIES: GNAT family N-acetyltransferase [Stenotrophomonas]|jgi:predicted N-acetyltransferase YhbS|uniref:GNAT family N-acetyltransferase n=1 Tax=Stenotrophomonas maltophilia TaxID=40324 RepID=A0A4S2CXW8_STEMA|nr:MULTISPECIES: GNAT family N-acetyltransferase [Stenotrophomonas]TGY33412.1 GNAT family N-acetyltransferase [Stenotrophomonas maltophilia]